QLVDAKAMGGLKRLRGSDELLGRAHFAAASFPIGIAEEQVACEFDGVAKLAAEKRVDRNAELVPDDVEAREFDRGVQLCAVVVKARGGIANRETHRLRTKQVVTAQVRFERREGARRVSAAAAHFAQSHVAIV